MPSKILDTLNEYFTQKIKEHGATPHGVGWNSTESQEIRFEQLCKIIQPNTPFSLLDFGCGYGAMYDYMSREHADFLYTGYDIAAEMIGKAAETHAENTNASWTTKLPDDKTYDYVITSGIFNLRVDISD